jgi:hypothetical protein
MSFSASDILRTVDSAGGRIGAASPLSMTSKPFAGTNGAASFAQVLNRHASSPAPAPAGVAGEEETKRRQQAEKAAGDLVSNALILPMLKQLRRSPWGENTVFSRGIAEKAFGPQFDMQISDRIAHSPRLGVKTALTERLLKRGQPDASSGNHIQPQQPAGKPPAAGSIDLHG